MAGHGNGPATGGDDDGGTRLPLLVAVSSGTLLNPLNSTMIAVALPAIRAEFGLTFTSAAWLISAHYLASAVGQPVMGRLSDLYGPRRIFIGGLFVVAAVSALAPLAPTIGWLLAFRVALAVGTSTLFPAGMTVVNRAIGSRHARALGVIAMFASLSAAVGPTLGGGLVSLAGWPGIFLVNLPFVALALTLAVRVMPRDARVTVRDRLIRRLDVPGAALFAVMVALLFAFLVSLPTGPMWWALAGGSVAAAAFVRTELRAPTPFIDLRVLRTHPSLTAVYAHFVVVNIGFYAMLFGIPVYLQEARGIGPAEAGVILVPLEGLAFLTLPLAARLIDRSDPRSAVLIGAGFATAGSALLLTVGATTGIAWLAVVLAVFGASVGFNNLGLQSALHQTAPPAMLGTASGLFMTSRYFGAVLSGSLLGIVFADDVGPAQLHAAAVVIAVLSAGTVALAWRHGLRPRAA